MQKYQTIEEIKEANLARGGNWFAPSPIGFHSSDIHPTIYGGNIFITSKCPKPDGIRLYTIRICRDNGQIRTVGAHDQYKSEQDAIDAIGLLSQGNM